MVNRDGASERERGREGEKELWLTFGQWRRGAVAFGSWLWRVHNAYCRATHRTNVCANASAQRATAAPPPLLVPLFHLNGHARRHPFSHHPSFTLTDFFATSLAFGKGNKIALLEEEEEKEKGRFLSFSLSMCLSIFLEGNEPLALGILDTRWMQDFVPFRRFKRTL